LERDASPAAERVFRLSPSQVFCDGAGARVGGVALLEREVENAGWRVRPIGDLNRELASAYGLPLDVSSKAAGLAVVAKALDCGDAAKAQIAMLLMRFPDPLTSDKGVRCSDDLFKLAGELAESGLIKDDDFESEHPRTGTPPNPGWFASKPKPARPPISDPRRAWPSSEINEEIRDWVVRATKALLNSGESQLIDGIPIADAIVWFVQGLGLGELNTGEQRILDQLYANFALPKTLEQLQTPPTDNALGYERHHIVGQTPSNIAKQDWKLACVLGKFGRDIIDAPNNIV
jgi:hypothetical protein